MLVDKVCISQELREHARNWDVLHTCYYTCSMHVSLHSRYSCSIMEYSSTPYVGMARGKNGRRINRVQNDTFKCLLFG